MAKARTRYQCSACAAVQPKWSGQCPECGAWNTLEEIAAEPRSQPRGTASAAESHRLDEVSVAAEPRSSTGLAELDRVLGGGLVPGSAVLLGGDPGVGKSTLLLQVLALMGDVAGLYVTGEESLQQVSLRARRLDIERGDLRLLAETSTERILATAELQQPRMLIIDSIQTLHTEALQSAPGSVAQVRDSAAQLVRYAKATGTALLLVGHVTKEGNIAGPRVLEHMVDTVVYFEGESGSRFRIVRAVKNRFGAANELGVFAMTDRGLKPVTNPSAIFLSRHEQPVPGSIIMVTREGTRPLLVEVQALVAENHAGNPRRIAVGVEQNRLAMLLAVMYRHGRVALFDQDVFVNAVGGVRISETAADLPLLLAALSSLRDRPLPSGLVAFGEVGLAGEIRPVPSGEERLREAAKHGFQQAIIPSANRPRHPPRGIELHPAARLQEAIEHL